MNVTQGNIHYHADNNLELNFTAVNNLCTSKYYSKDDM